MPDPLIFKSIGNGEYSIANGGMVLDEVHFFYSKSGSENKFTLKSSWGVECLAESEANKE